MEGQAAKAEAGVAGAPGAAEMGLEVLRAPPVEGVAGDGSPGMVGPLPHGVHW